VTGTSHRPRASRSKAIGGRRRAEYVVGIALIVIAGIYFVTPADTLPSFFLGHKAGVMRVHVKHGIVAGAAGLVMPALGWWLGRR